MMKINRATLSVLFLVAPALLMAGCGDREAGSRAAATSVTETTVDPATVTSTTSTDNGYIDAARCFRDLGAKPVSSARALAFAKPGNVTIEAAGTTTEATHPISFMSVRGKPFRIYAVAKAPAIATKAQVLRHPERIPFVGYLPPGATAKEIKAGRDCLDGYRGL